MQYGCAAFAAVSNAVVQCNRLRVVMGGGGRKTGSATHTHTHILVHSWNNHPLRQTTTVRASESGRTRRAVSITQIHTQTRRQQHFLIGWLGTHRHTQRRGPGNWNWRRCECLRLCLYFSLSLYRATAPPTHTVAHNCCVCVVCACLATP